MRFVIVGPAYPFRGGIVHHTAMLTAALTEAGHEAFLFAFSHGYPRWLFPGKTDRDPSANPLQVPIADTIHPWQPWRWRQAADRIARQQPDGVIIEWWVPFWAPLQMTLARRLRQLGVPVFMDCQNVLPHSYSQWGAAATRYTLGSGDGCMVYSETHQQELHGLLPQMVTSLVAYPVYGAIAHSHMGREVARQQLQVTGDVVLFFGFVRPYKGLSVLLKALAQLREQGKHVHLLVVGEFWRGSEKERQLIDALGLAAQTTVVDEYVPDEMLDRYFMAADVLVMPYIEPVQSGVLAVAQAFKIPVIASDVGGLRENIELEKTGLLAPPNDPTALAATIATFFADGWRQRMLPYVQAIKQDAGWAQVVAEWVRLVHERRVA